MVWSSARHRVVECSPPRGGSPEVSANTLASVGELSAIRSLERRSVGRR